MEISTPANLSKCFCSCVPFKLNKLSQVLKQSFPVIYKSFNNVKNIYYSDQRILSFFGLTDLLLLDSTKQVNLLLMFV